MCTIVKVKRKTTDEPPECLILKCKKKKPNSDSISSLAATNLDCLNNINTNSNENELFKQVFRYVGTGENEDELNKKILNINDDIDLVKSNFSKRAIKNPKRKRTNDKVDSNRMSYIMIDDNENNIKEDKKKSNINILNVMPSIYDQKINCNGVELIREKVNLDENDKCNKSENEKFVYDIYYVKNSDSIDFNWLNSKNYEIKSFTGYFENEELVDDLEESEDEYRAEDDEDSNDELNWRNDYPDEEENDDEEDYYGSENEDEYEDGFYRNCFGKSSKYNDEDSDDYDDEYNDKKLSNFLKKSCTIDKSYNDEFDDEEDDYDQYANDKLSKLYLNYKKRILKEERDRTKDSDTD